jgi:alkane 1-monooxygenase
VQAFAAICLLEIVNYVEHYGLERRKRANGRYEPVQPHHSWNSNHRMTNFLLINLQRHSDHHYQPSRRFPVLQAYSEDDAPQLPYGYPLMVLAALVPPLWFSIMNPRLVAWHTKYDQKFDLQS